MSTLKKYHYKVYLTIALSLNGNKEYTTRNTINNNIQKIVNFLSFEYWLIKKRMQKIIIKKDSIDEIKWNKFVIENVGAMIKLKKLIIIVFKV